MNYQYRVYHQSACSEAEHTVSRHRSYSAAQRAAAKAKRDLAEAYPGGNLLCGYIVQERTESGWGKVSSL
jgi:hypothetical protein